MSTVFTIHFLEDQQVMVVIENSENGPNEPQTMKLDRRSKRQEELPSRDAA